MLEKKEKNSIKSQTANTNYAEPQFSCKKWENERSFHGINYFSTKIMYHFATKSRLIFKLVNILTANDEKKFLL